MHIIRKLTCPEHLCRIFAREKLEERVAAGELRIVHDAPTPKIAPYLDYNGLELTHNQNSRILDDRFNDERHIAAKVHRHLTITGVPGASGKYDPKTVTLPNGTKYQPLNPPEGPCELCEEGDMIFPWSRFYKAKYRPSFWRCIKSRFRVMMRV